VTPLALALLAVGLFPAGDEATARAELEAVRASFAVSPRAESEAALVAIGDHFPSTESGARALLWAGDLATQDKQLLQGRTRYLLVAQRFPRGELHAFALRGTGNVALLEHRWADARDAFAAALADAPPLLAVELREKRALAERERRRFFVEAAAWIAIALALAWFTARLRRPLALPLATRVVAPVYALVLAAAWGRDEGVFHALLWLAAGSLPLITLALASTAPRAPRRALVDGAVLAVANGALFYVALRRSGIVDSLWQTLQAGGAVG